MSRESTAKTITVAVSVSLVCAIVVSVAAVALRPVQARNQALDKKSKILAAAGLLSATESVEEVFKRRIRAKLIELDGGAYSERFPPDAYDQRKATRDPGLSVAIPESLDVAGFRRRAKFASVYEVYENERCVTVILPIYGLGLWSTMYGFLAVDAVTEKVVGIGFYEHGETPGLGGEVDNERWKAGWRGKSIFDGDDRMRLMVLKGRVESGSPDAEYQIDGLAGSTLTTNGLRRMIQYWLGPHGFGPYLQQIRQRRNSHG